MSPTTPPLEPIAPVSTRRDRRERRRARRESRWDRRPIRDWRYVVGMFGRILIWTGVMMFGFVAYQLWGTGIQTARAQSSMENEFMARVAEVSAVSDGGTIDPATGGGPIDPAADDGPIDADALSGAMDAQAISQLLESPIVPGGLDLSDEAVDQNLPTPITGEAILRLQIPAIDKDLFVVAGVRLEDLRKGPGHYPDTPMPGQLGNAAIAGHRTTYGAPFFDVAELEPGDDLIVTNLLGQHFVYTVTNTEIVYPTDYHVVETKDPNVASLTLTACHPHYSARQRIVVHSVLDPEHSDRVGRPSYYNLLDDVPVATPVGTDVPTSSSVVSDGETEATMPGEPVDEPAAPVDEPGAAVPDASVPGPPTGGIERADVFTQGWFDDPAAWPHIAGWGALLAATMLGAYLLARRTRRTWVGVVAVAVPYVVVSYFLFENVNRLLPPGL